jgi:hypothetical protein
MTSTIIISSSVFFFFTTYAFSSDKVPKLVESTDPILVRAAVRIQFADQGFDLLRGPIRDIVFGHVCLVMMVVGLEGFSGYHDAMGRLASRGTATGRCGDWKLECQTNKRIDPLRQYR